MFFASYAISNGGIYEFDNGKNSYAKITEVGIYVTIPAPGVTPEDVDVELIKDELFINIKGKEKDKAGFEIKTSKRSMILPEDYLPPDNVEVKDGLIKLLLKKKEIVKTKILVK